MNHLWILILTDGYTGERIYVNKFAEFNSLFSGQLVTLTTTIPPQVVKIQCITADHGLLRTLPEGETGSKAFIDLQPDGNSFDMLVGLIKTKT